MHAMQTTVATTVGSNSRFSCLCARHVFESAADYQLADHYACLWISSQMIIYNVPIGSDVRMTKLRDNKFWRSARPTKLRVRMEGPSTIEHVHVNGNLTTLLRKGITERINIHRDLSYCWPFHIPPWRQFLAWIVFEVFTFYLWSFFSTSHLSELQVEFSGSSFCLFTYGRVSLAMDGKSVMPTEITYMDTEDEYKYMVSKIHIFKVHIFKLLSVTYYELRYVTMKRYWSSTP